MITLLSPLISAWLATRTYYVVTDRRAFIFEKAWSLKIHAFEPAAIAGFERISHGDNRGEINFAKALHRYDRAATQINFGFIGLRDFPSAENALRTMIKQNSPPASSP